jgi:hypothetical protein
MTKLSNVFARVRSAVIVSAVALGPLLGACSDVTDTMLDAVDPDVIPPESTNSAEGATSLYNGALAGSKP